MSDVPIGLLLSGGLVGRCRLPVLKPESNAHLLSALETKM